MIQILIVDDEKPICDLIQMSLTRAGYHCTCVYDGLAAADILERNVFDLILLDVMLPNADGFELMEYIRPLGIPVIFLTARGSVDDRVRGLRMGAEDYIVKPFDSKEVIARIKAVVRRTGQSPAEMEVREVRYDKLSVNMTRYELKVDGKVVDAPPKELELLFYLASNPNRVYTRDQLLDEVWGFEYYGDSRTIDVHIKRLREKLEGVSDKWELKTVWGVGYKFETDEED